MGPYDPTTVASAIGLAAGTTRYVSPWTEEIFSPDTGQSSIWSLMRGMPWEDSALGSPIFNWDEQTLPPMTDTNTGTPTSAADQVMTVDHIVRWVGLSIVKNKRTGEFILVDQVTTDFNLTYVKDGNANANSRRSRSPPRARSS